MEHKSLKSPLGQVRGLGSAKDGLHHWWMQRLTAIALIPLSIWLVVSLLVMSGAGHDEMVAWMTSPITAGIAILLIIATFWHAMLGVQVVIEDYVHDATAKMALLLISKGALILIGAVTAVAVIKLMIQG